MIQTYPDQEVGITLQLPFRTETPDGVLTDQFRAVNQAGVDPVAELRRIDGTVVADNPGGSLIVQYNTRPGIHLMTWNTATSIGANPGTAYELVCTDGERSDGAGGWLSMIGEPLIHFPLRGGAAGYLASRCVELAEGEVKAITSPQQFTVEIYDRAHNVAPFNDPNYYKNLGISFQSGNLFGSSRNILRNVTSGTDVVLVLQRPFVSEPNIGDKFAIIPEEQTGPIVLAHITAIPHTGEYYCVWTKGADQVNPDTDKTFISAYVLEDGSVLFEDAEMQKTTAGGYYHSDVANLAPPNSGIEVVCKGTFDGVNRAWPRPYPRTA